MSNRVIPEEFLDLFDKKAFANLATLMAMALPRSHRSGVILMGPTSG